MVYGKQNPKWARNRVSLRQPRHLHIENTENNGNVPLPISFFITMAPRKKICTYEKIFAYFSHIFLDKNKPNLLYENR